VDAIDAHVALHDQLDADKAQAASAGLRYPPVGPLSQALPHPVRRPAFLMTGARTDAGGGSRRGGSRRHLARADKGDEAELPDWARMQAGDRREGPIPRHDLHGVSVRPEIAHRLRIAQPMVPQAAARSAPPNLDTSVGNMDAAMRRAMAVAGRARVCAWLFGPLAAGSPARILSR